MKTRALSILLCIVLCCGLLPISVLAVDGEVSAGSGLAREWNLEELKQVVDVTDPRSVAAYWVWAVNRLVDDYDDGMSMMKYLFADIEPYGSGYTEGGLSGRAGWDIYFNDRLKDPDYSWLPRAYLEGTSARNGFKPDRPIRVALIYNSTETESLNGQRLAQQEQQGRLNIAYVVQSHAAGNRVSITLSQFSGSTRWYVTNGSSSNTMFYDQRGSLDNDALALAAETSLDDSTAEEHQRRYSGSVEQPVPSAAPISGTEVVTSVALAVVEPEAWQTPSFTGRVIAGECLIDLTSNDEGINGIKWLDVTDGEEVLLTEADTFQPERQYQVTISITPKDGYIFNTEEFNAVVNENDVAKDNQSVYEDSAEISYTFPVLGTDSAPFADVEATDYYYEAVNWAYTAEPQVTNGVGDGQFGPDTTCTRAQVMTFIWRAAGCPSPKNSENRFTDIPDDIWYSQPVLWAVEQGITNGVGENQFGPELTCTRGQVITMLYRAAGEPNKTGLGEWYDDAVNWATSIGLLSGTEEAFIPEDDCPRKDIVLYLFRELAE